MNLDSILITYIIFGLVAIKYRSLLVRLLPCEASTCPNLAYLCTFSLWNSGVATALQFLILNR